MTVDVALVDALVSTAMGDVVDHVRGDRGRSTFIVNVWVADCVCTPRMVKLERAVQVYEPLTVGVPSIVPSARYVMPGGRLPKTTSCTTAIFPISADSMVVLKDAISPTKAVCSLVPSCARVWYAPIVDETVDGQLGGLGLTNTDAPVSSMRTF